MHAKGYLLPLCTLAILAQLPGCGNSDNDVGTLPPGSGGSGGWVGPDCDGPDGLKYAVGKYYFDGCNQCSCQVISSEPLTTGFRCTSFVCPDGGSGTGGTAGSPDVGGFSGAGGAAGSTGTATGQCTDSDGTTYAVGATFKKDCNTCRCELMGDTIGPVLACTVMACPDAGTDAPAPGDGGGQSEAAGVPDGACLLSYNDVLVPDGSAACCYHKGGANTCSTAITCNDISGLDCCLIYGTEHTSYGPRCCLRPDGAPVDGAEECRQLLGPAPTLPPSACPACGTDELCVAYYDGTCKAMSTSCRKVSATTRQSILVEHARCFSSPMGDEICGTRDGLHFWGCGEPACPQEPLVSDINCYGP